jgi:hypothetical protein
LTETAFRPLQRKDQGAELLLLSSCALREAKFLKDVGSEGHEDLQVADALEVVDCAEQAPDEVVCEVLVDPVPVEIVDDDVGEVLVVDENVLIQNSEHLCKPRQLGVIDDPLEALTLLRSLLKLEGRPGLSGPPRLGHSRKLELTPDCSGYALLEGFCDVTYSLVGLAPESSFEFVQVVECSLFGGIAPDLLADRVEEVGLRGFRVDPVPPPEYLN